MTGVLALQGGFAEHITALQKLGEPCFEIRQNDDKLQHADRLILPGGESTVMIKLLRELGLYGPLRERIEGGTPVLGTCAGLILLAREVENRGEHCFGAIDIRARRNAYGRQLGSFFAREAFAELADVPMTFIRAPYIESVGEGVEILARTGGHIVAARQGSVLVTAFHPELSDDLRVHRYFLENTRSIGQAAV